MKPSGYIEEEEEEEEFEEEYWPLTIRAEVIEYILRRCGCLKARDIARILGCKPSDVQQTLKQLERSGRVKKAKLGRSYVWSSMEEFHSNLMYY
jgi:DNA-binding MarR family transcriptional regulator